MADTAGFPPTGVFWASAPEKWKWLGEVGGHIHKEEPSTPHEWPPSQLEAKGDTGQDRVESGTDSRVEAQAQCSPCRNQLTDRGKLLNLLGFLSHLRQNGEVRPSTGAFKRSGNHGYRKQSSRGSLGFSSS